MQNAARTDARLFVPPLHGLSVTSCVESEVEVRDWGCTIQALKVKISLVRKKSRPLVKRTARQLHLSQEV